MNNWKVIFATVVIFGAGVITGGLLVNYVQHSTHPKLAHKIAAVPEVHAAVTNQPATNQMVRASDAPKLRPPEILSKQFLQRLKDELHLTADENDAIQKIIAEGQNQIRKVMQDSRLEIRDVLTPDQQKQFDDLVKRPNRKVTGNTNTIAAAALSALPDGDFKTRLAKILDTQPTNQTVPVSPTAPLPRPPRYNSTSSNLSPEAQVILMEAQRAQEAQPQNALLPPPPPIAVTNASGL